MACANCNQGALDPVDVDEPSDSGSFSEEYECTVCGAKGFIFGNEQDPPSRWDRTGAAYNGSEF